MPAGKVVDFSFLEASRVEDFYEVEPVNAEDLKKEDETECRPPVGLRLCYNHLMELPANLASSLNTLTGGFALTIQWLDLSFNKITSIQPLLVLSELRVLYLHANAIDKIAEVKSLGALPKLAKLTLHGNPVSHKKHYRNMVIYLMPSLHVLDFSLVTGPDKRKALLWSNLNKHALLTEPPPEAAGGIK